MQACLLTLKYIPTQKIEDFVAHPRADLAQIDFPFQF